MPKLLPPFKVILILSFAALALLGIGYFSTPGVIVAHTPPPLAGGFARQVNVQLDCGRVSIYAIKRPSSGPKSWHLEWLPRFWSVRFPQIKRSIWEFDAHQLTMMRPGGSAYLFAFPIWCIAWPFCIAPAIWLRRKRRERKETRGFRVKLSNAAEV